MKTAEFEIKIALLGYVSVGKTTVLNALLRDKYSEVSMRRTTAGVSHFRLNDHQQSNAGAAAVLEEITQDNQKLRSDDSEEVEEKFFDLLVSEDFVCTMRDDTTLTLVDIPGINEAGSSDKYKKYVKDKWDTFDCVIVVMDARQGVNTEEQVQLLKMVETNVASIKAVPVIVLCNKVDEPESSEQQVLVKEAREAVEEIFHCSDREESLQKALTKGSKLSVVKTKNKPKTTADSSDFPAFIPVSAINAYIFRTASLMSLEQFAKFDADLVDKLGREFYGRGWKVMGKREKIEAAFEVVHGGEYYKEGMEASKFDTFLEVLELAVGSKKQLALLQAQVDVQMKNLAPSKDFVEGIGIVYKNSQALNKPTTTLPETFWELYMACEKTALDVFEAAPRRVDQLALPMQQLLVYTNLSEKAGWDEDASVKDAMLNLIRKQVDVIQRKYRETKEKGCKLESVASKDGSWKSVSFHDWKTLIGSMLLNSSRDDFMPPHELGMEILMLQDLLHRISAAQVPETYPCNTCSNALSQRRGYYSCDSCSHRTVYFKATEKPASISCPFHANYSCPLEDGKFKCKTYCNRTFDRAVLPLKDKKHVDMKLVDGEWEVEDETDKQLVTITVPQDGPSDPNHFGHLLFKYCRIVALMD